MQDRDDDFKNSGQVFEADLNQITCMEEEEEEDEKEEEEN